LKQAHFLAERYYVTFGYWHACHLLVVCDVHVPYSTGLNFSEIFCTIL